MNDISNRKNQLDMAAYWMPFTATHQAGSACGADLSGKPSSTIGFGKRWNPLLSLDRAAFIEKIVAEIPARPPMMEAMRRANLGLAA